MILRPRQTDKRKEDGYNGNPNLPKETYQHEFTRHEHDEFVKCMNDPIYFAKTYVQIINVDKGLMPFEMWDFQERMIQEFNDNRFVICKLPRQQGKTTTVIAFLLHYILFNMDVAVAILANKGVTARKILDRLRLAYEYLPRFLQQGVREWNKGNILLANRSRILADSTSGSSVRGDTFNIIFLDEFAFIPNNLQEDFFNSTYPTISSGQTTKVLIVSTPNGMNLFYEIWQKAIKKKNSYKAIDIHWSEHPNRDQKWKEETIANTSEEQFRQEFETEFIGSTNTLISPTKLRILANIVIQPAYVEDKLTVYDLPKKDHVYAITVDPSQGQGLDYSAFSVFDITTIPYKQVALYRDNRVSHQVLPIFIKRVANHYNDAHVLIEINDIGQEVASILWDELEYENVMKVEAKSKTGQRLATGFGTKELQLGVKTSTQVKRIGCSALKALIENDKLELYDFTTIRELTTFVAKKQSFEADEGHNDDTSMTLVLFAWLTNQQQFKDAFGSDIRKTLQEQDAKLKDYDVAPFGFMSDREGEVRVDNRYTQGSDNFYSDGNDVWIVEDMHSDFGRF